MLIASEHAFAKIIFKSYFWIYILTIFVSSLLHWPEFPKCVKQRSAMKHIYFVLSFNGNATSSSSK